MKRARGPWDDIHQRDGPLQLAADQRQVQDQDSGTLVLPGVPHQHRPHLHEQQQQQQQQPQQQEQQAVHTLTEEGYASPGLIGIEGRVLKKLRRITLSSQYRTKIPPLQSSPENEANEHSSTPWQETMSYSNHGMVRQYQHPHFQQTPSRSSQSQGETAASLFSHGPIRISTRTHITLQPPTIHIPDMYTQQLQQQPQSQPQQRQHQQHQQHQQQQYPQEQRREDGSINISDSRSHDNSHHTSSSTLLDSGSSNLSATPQSIELYTHMNSLLQELHSARFGLPTESHSTGLLYAPQGHQQPEQPLQRLQKVDDDDDMMDAEAFTFVAPPPLQQQLSQSAPSPMSMENHEYDGINAKLRAAFLARHPGTHL
ncbi:hypothetical protein BGZ73_000677 [Actinomortierella ambigua]|nr:hypothetical protein BGZ73_000677 [Actinomortierella ambigua]